jgi:hypothetical protein
MGLDEHARERFVTLVHTALSRSHSAESETGSLSFFNTTEK